MESSKTSRLLVGIVFCVALLLSISAYLTLAAVRSTERLVSQFQRQDQEIETFAGLVDMIPGGVARIHVSTGRFAYINQGFEEISGYSRQELVGTSILLLIPKQFQSSHVDRIENPERWWDEHGTEATCIPKARLVRRDKSVVGCDMIITGIHVDGNKVWQLFIDPRTVVLIEQDE